MQVQDAEKLILKVLKTASAKQKYLLHQLKAHWADVAGFTAAKHTQPYKLERRVLYVHTDYPLWSQTLLTSKGSYIQKINRVLSLKGTEYTVKDLKVFHGVLEEENKPKEDAESFMPKVDHNRRCPFCGAPLIPGETICISCYGKQQEAIRQHIHQCLMETPWITYEDCRKMVECDKIIFTDVKQRTVDFAVNKALEPKAEARAKYFAVMLCKGLTPAELDDDTVEEILQEEKRRRVYVPARRK